MTDFVEKFECTSDRVISCSIKLKDSKPLHVIVAYAPHSGRPDEEVDLFYDDIEKTIDKKKYSHTILLGDFNAKIGTKEVGEDINCMGEFGIGDRNPRGEILINFAEEQKLFISNTMFKKAKNRYWTWESPNKESYNLIDYIFVSHKSIIQDCGVLTSAYSHFPNYT